MALTAKQKRFIAEYLGGFNATEAAKRAGYSEKTAYSIGHENLRKPEIAAEIAKIEGSRCKKFDITQERVLQELARIAFSDPRNLYDKQGQLKPPKEWDDATAAVIASVESDELFEGRGNDRQQIGWTKKVKQWDKVAALDKLGKHLKLFNEQGEAKDIDWTRIGYSELAAIRDGLVAALGTGRLNANRNGTHAPQTNGVPH